MNRLEAYWKLKRGLEQVTEEAEAEAREAICLLAGCQYHEIFLQGSQELGPDEAEKIEEILQRRRQREPLAYIIGERWFMGLRFAVDRRALIPRQDTELLAEAAIQYIEENQCERALDLCTGSGCVAIAIGKYTNAKVTGADISQEALDVAEKNGADNGVDITWVCSDLFAQIGGKYQVITANPPYISGEEYEGLMREVRDYEPRLALVGPEKGLAYYRRICREAKGFLRPGGALIMEIGWNQGPAVREILESRGFLEIEIRKDWAGLDRLAIGRNV